MKPCKLCGVAKPLSDFSRHATTKDKLQTWCKPCRAAELRRWRAANPEQSREHSRRWDARNPGRKTALARTRYAANPKAGARQYLAWRIRRDFGLTLEEYDAIVSQPCGLCGRLADVILDHDHITGKVRGPLCQMCNKAIGVLGDDPDRLRAAADYIEQHRT